MAIPLLFQAGQQQLLYLTNQQVRVGYKTKIHEIKLKKYAVVQRCFSLTPFKYLFYIPTRLLVIFKYEICEVVFYDFIAKMFAIALIFIGVVCVFKTKLKN